MSDYDATVLVYTDEAAVKARVKPATIRQWAHRHPKLLPVVERDWRGRPRYRLADVLEVEKATRRNLTMRNSVSH